MRVVRVALVFVLGSWESVPASAGMGEAGGGAGSGVGVRCSFKLGSVRRLRTPGRAVRSALACARLEVRRVRTRPWGLSGREFRVTLWVWSH